MDRNGSPRPCSGVDDFKAGQAVMKELARVIPRRRKVAVLSGNPNAPNLRSRVEGMVLLAQPTYLWGEVGVDKIVDEVLLGKVVPERIPMDLVSRDR